MEATGCRLAMTDHRTLVIVLVYLPSPKLLLRTDLRALLALGDAVILFGDFNCKNSRWGCATRDHNGEKLDRLRDRLEFEVIAPSTVTYFPHTVTSRPSTLDIAITKGVALNLNSIETLHCLLSNHRPVLLKMGPPNGGRPMPTIKITDCKIVSTAFEKIDTPPLNSIPDDIRTIEEIDHAIGALTSHVRTLVEKCEWEVPASSDHRKLPPDILQLIRAKNAALHRASAYPTPEYRSRARAFQCERITKAFKTEGYTPIPPLKRPDNSVALDDTEVAERLADSIESQCSHASLPHDIAHISRIEEEVIQKTSRKPKDDLTPVSLSEVQTLVKSLSTRKAPGLDGISNEAIKCFSQPLLSLLVAIFNACLKNCYFPPAWKEAEVIDIHKPGKPRDLPASYRPISLLSGLAKLFERVLKTRLSDHLFGKGFIIDEQFGFRPAHSCPQQVLRLVEHERTHSTRRLISAGVPQGSAICPLLYSAYTNDIPRLTSGIQLAIFADDTALFFRSRDRRSIFRHLPRAIDKLGVTLDKNLLFRDHIARVRKTALFYTARLGAMLSRKSKLSRRYKRTLYKMCIRTVLTYASPVFAHVAPKAHWCVRNSILHRDLELPTITKYMKDALKRFFDIAGSHPNALLHAVVDYEPPLSTHFIRRPRNVLNDLPDVRSSTLLHPAAVNRLQPGRRNGNRPVTVSSDILYRDDTLQESSIGHVTRRRHSHVPSGRAR
ncbi:RNA-directed DNA polymerase from mobile element jockey [Eumeta japonica]|uniref:RNA-directed DNA polymerase from mobile element jockey n=1 Tax=Eumeta variegata TaxID=151549 RepID=A0A4C1VC82_EUMVA|nr:RNA-directed DNA polymerase from mobile element jockey [Eumeta japonica]